MTNGDDGRLLLFCHAGCAFQTIAGALGDEDLPVSRARFLARRPIASASTRDREASIKRLIARSSPASGSVVRMYLGSRGINLTPPPDLRCLASHRHQPSGRFFPVMLAMVRDCSASIVGLHRTYLALDGSAKAEVVPAKMSLGPIAGGAVRLHDADADLQRLAVSEGIETGLSVAQATALPVWASLSAGGVEQLVLPPLPLARDVLIFADRDHHGRGQRAAETAARRFVSQGRTLRIILPNHIDTDFNDMLQGRG
jgi:phage/plasmid primase-like uncharacterized protein